MCPRRAKLVPGGRLIGVDGITPTTRTERAVLAERGMRRPEPVRQPRGRECVATADSGPDGRLDERDEDDDD